MKWITATGLILQFFAFWFAAPELLGASTLKRFEKGLRKLIALIPLVFMTLVILGYGLTFFISGIVKAVKSQTEGIEEGELFEFFITLGVASILYFIFIFYYKKIKAWLETKVAQPLIYNLIENNHIRSISLVIGAVLFTLGFVLQIIAVLL